MSTAARTVGHAVNFVMVLREKKYSINVHLNCQVHPNFRKCKITGETSIPRIAAHNILYPSTHLTTTTNGLICVFKYFKQPEKHRD